MSSQVNPIAVAKDIAFKMLKAAHGDEHALKASARFGMAMGAVRAGMKDRSREYFDKCCQDSLSLAQAIATSIETDLFPGGPHPPCYLIPQDGRINWRITHRGVAILAAREGLLLKPVPVHVDDHLVVQLGEVIDHKQNDDAMSLDELAGVCVVVRDMQTGADVARHWVSRKRIEARADKSDSRKKGFGPWKEWDIEMAQKTAILYLAARGAIPMDSPAWREAVAADYRAADVSEPATMTRIERPAIDAPAVALLADGDDLLSGAMSQTVAAPVEAR